MIPEKVKNLILEYGLFEPGDKVVVAVSGGPDSLCLLHVLHNMSSRLGLKLIVAHLNHCMRPEADTEQEAVRKAAESLDLPFEFKAADVRAFRKKSGRCEEEAGRILRYRFMIDVARKYGAFKIALGHQLEDQAETVLFNMIRGTGMDGLAGILPKRALGPVCLVRPLLTTTRREIEDYCVAHNLKPSTDSSNLQTFYTRNQIRLELIPYLEKTYNPKIKEALAALAKMAASDRLFLGRLARIKFNSLARVNKNGIEFKRSTLLALPKALRSRVIRLALKRFTPAGKISRAHTEAILSLLEHKGPFRELALPGKTRVYSSYDRLLVTVKAALQGEILAERKLKIPGVTVLPGRKSILAAYRHPASLKWPPPAEKAYLDYKRIPSDKPLTVRSRWAGARFHPQGASGSKKLKDFFIDQKIARGERDARPLVTAGDEIIWVAGIRVGDPYRVTASTRKVLVLHYRLHGLRI